MDPTDFLRRSNGSQWRAILGWLTIGGFVLAFLMWPEGPPQMPIRKSQSRNGTGFPSVRPHEIEKNSSKFEDDSLYVQGQSLSASPGDSKKSVDLETWLAKYRGGKRKPNVLFLVADDMRPDIKAFAHAQSPWIMPHMVTPNLDALASRGLLLRRAYCQQAWCNPSRSSFLTSRRPDTTMVHNNSVFFRQINPNFITLPQYFKQHGYLTLGMGKIFHLAGLTGDHDDDFSWTLPMLRNEDYLDEGRRAVRAVKLEDRKGKLLLDEVVTDFAIETLNKVAPLAKKGQQPFFVAVGAKKPHLSFVFPEKYLNYYPMENISMPVNPLAPEKMPGIAWFHSNEIRGRSEYLKETENWGKREPLAEWVVKELRRAYWATITYVDDLLGQVMAKLEEHGVADDTIISFVGDHGFHLGEHSIVGKNTAFEVANNSPMIIHVPGVTDGGLVTDKLVEFVDIFPTLADLAGLPPVPRCPGRVDESQQVDLCTEGSSLLPLFQDQASSQWKEQVFYQYPHYTGEGDRWCMGYSMRTEQYRYTEWITYHYSTGANWNETCGLELYDHVVDPHETFNRADDANLLTIREDLSHKLRAGWSEAIPR